MTVIELNDDLAAALRAKAAAQGFALEDWLKGLAYGTQANAAKPAKRLLDVLSMPPFAGSELIIERSKDLPRLVDL